MGTPEARQPPQPWLASLSYLYGLVFAAAAYWVSRGTSGRLKLMFFLFALAGCGYAAVMLSCFRRRVTVHSLGHWAAFTIACMVASSIDSRLEGMAGMLGMLILWALWGGLLLGAVVLFFGYPILQKARSRPRRGMR